jgi:hypothetical protein
MNPYQAGDEPTDAELSAAIERGLADGSLIDSADWLAMNSLYNPGDIVTDLWTRETVTVVAGAQASNHVTVAFPDGTVTSVNRRHLDARFHAFNDDGSDPGNCSVCHFFHR